MSVLGRDSTATDAKPAFRLLRYFSWAGLVSIVGVAVLLSFLYREMAERDMLTSVNRDNAVIARALRTSLSLLQNRASPC